MKYKYMRGHEPVTFTDEEVMEKFEKYYNDNAVIEKYEKGELIKTHSLLTFQGFALYLGISGETYIKIRKDDPTGVHAYVTTIMTEHNAKYNAVGELAGSARLWLANTCDDFKGENHNEEEKSPPIINIINDLKGWYGYKVIFTIPGKVWYIV